MKGLRKTAGILLCLSVVFSLAACKKRIKTYAPGSKTTTEAKTNTQTKPNQTTKATSNTTSKTTKKVKKEIGFDVVIDSEYKTNDNTLTYHYGDEIYLFDELKINKKYDDGSKEELFYDASGSLGYNYASTMTDYIDGINNASAGTYTFTISYKDYEDIIISVVVEKYNLSITNIGNPSKEYDGSTISQITYELETETLAYNKDNVQVFYKLSTEPDTAYTTTLPKNAGTYIAQIIAPESSAYNKVYETKEFEITKKNLTISDIISNNKAYDGNTNAYYNTTGTLVGLVTGDDVEIDYTNAKATFADELVGTNKNVLFEGFSLTGDDANNYTVSQPEAVIADIAKATITNVSVTGYEGIIDYNSHDIVAFKSATTINNQPLTWLFSKDGIDYVESITVKDIADSGTYYYKVSAPNHKDVINTFEVTVADKSIPTITLNEVLDKVYDGLEVSPNYTVTGDGIVSVKYYKDSIELAYCPSNAGTYEIEISTTETATYNPKTVKFEFTISKKELTITGACSSNKVYDGTTNASITGDMVLVGVVGSDDVTIDLTNAVAAFANANANDAISVAFAGFALAGDDRDNYTVTQPESVIANITKADYDLTGISFTDASKAFNNELQGIELTGILPTGLDGITLTVNYTGMAINAGEYLITATFNTTSTNYNIPDALTATLTITKIDYDLTGISFTDDTKVYNGSEQGLTITGILPTGLDGITLTINYTGMATNAGEYLITATFNTTSINYNIPDALTATLTITKATYDMSGITFVDGEKVYNGSAQGLTITGTLPTGLDGVQVTVNYTGSVTNVGSDIIIATFATTSINYLVPESMNATLTVTPATITNVLVTGYHGTYDGEAHNIVASKSATTVDGSIITWLFSKNNVDFVDALTVTIPSEAGIYYYKAIAENHITKEGQFEVVISGKINPNLVLTNTLDKVYDSTSVNPIYTYDTDGSITVTYTKDSIICDTPTDAGTYLIKITSAETTDYYAGLVEKIFTISKKELTITGANSSNKVYDGTTNASITGDMALVGIVGSDEVTIDSTNATATFANANVGDAIAVAFAGFALAGDDANNYTVAQPESVTANITKADYAMSGVTFVDDEKIYNGSAQSLTITGTLPTGFDGIQITVNYTGSVTNVGSEVITATFATTSTNYNVPENLTATLTITPATITNDLVTGYQGTYDGNAHNIVATKSATTVDSSTITWSFSNDQTNWVDEITVTMPSEAGTYYYKASAANHNDVIKSFTVTISGKATATISLNNVLDKTYDGVAVTPDYETTGDGIATVKYYSGDTLLPGAPINAGTYKLVIITSETTDYYTKTFEQLFTISKKELTITGANSSNKVYDSTTNASITGDMALVGVVGSDDVTIDSSSATATFANANANDAISVAFAGFALAGADANNYTVAQPESVTANITKADYDMTGVTFVDDEKIYNGSAQSLTITGILPTGLDGIQITVNYTGSVTNVGSEVITATFATTSTNYNIPESLTATLTIAKATMSGISVNGYSGTYDYLDHNIVASKSATTVDGSEVTWLFSSDNETFVEAITVNLPADSGTYYYKATAANHNDATGSFEVIVSDKINPNITLNNDLDKEYNGTSVNPDYSFDGDGEATVKYYVDSVEYIGTPKNAGTYTIKITTTETATYFAGSFEQTFTISKKSLTTTGVDADDKVYDGTTSAAIINGTLVGIIDGDNVTIDLTNAVATFANANVGDAIAVAFAGFALAGADASNYILVQPTSVTANITKADYAMSGVTFVDDEKIYNGSAQSLTITGTLPTGFDGIQITVNYTGSVTNVGSGVITATFATTSTNYNVPENLTATLTITPATMTAVSVTGFNGAYDGNAHNIVATKAATTVDSSTITWSFSKGQTNWVDEITVTMPSEAGTYYYKATAANHNDATGTLTVTITGKATATITLNNVLDKTYDGVAVTPDYETTGDGIATVKYYSGDDELPSAPINAGTYKIAITTSETTDYYSKTFEQSFTISKKELTITGARSSNKVYDVTTNASITGDMSLVGVVGSDDVTIDSSSATATFANANVGDAIAVAFAGFALAGADASNYTLVQPTSVTANITKADYDMTGVTFVDDEKIYNGSAQGLTITGTLPTGFDGIQITVNYTGSVTNVGSGVITATFATTSTNYNVPENLTATLTIAKATMTAVSVTGFNGAYDGNAHNIVATKAATTVDSSGVTWSFSKDQTNWVDEITVTMPSEAGTYYYKATAANHNDATGTLTVTINGKVTTTIDITNTLDRTYDGTSLNATYTTNSDGEVTVEYYDGDTLLPSAPINAGTYSVKITTTETTNYYAGSKTQQFTISKKSLTTTGVDADDKIYDDTTTATIINGTLVDVVTGDEVTIDLTSATATFADANVGDAIAVSFAGFALAGADASNYTLVQPTSVTANITKADYDMSGVTFNNDTITYDGSTHGLTITGTLPTGLDDIQVTVSYSDNVTNAGSHTITATFATTSTNYNAPEAMTATLTIEKADYDMSSVSFDDASKPYNGSEQGLSITGTLPTNVSVSYTGMGTNAGTYTVTATFATTDTNYNAPTAITATLTITKINPVYEAPTAKSLTYTGSSLDLINAGSATGGTMQYSLDNETFSTSIPQGINAESYVVYYKVIGDANHNDVAAQSVLVVVAPKEVTVVWANTTYTYTGSVLTNPTATFDGNAATVTCSSTFKNAGNYTFTASTTNTNYTLTNTTKDYSVAKANPTYTVPTGLEVLINRTLSSVKLPTGFAWDSPTTNVGNIEGEFSYTATYTPSDTTNYNSVSNISITITVTTTIPMVIDCEDNQEVTYNSSEQSPVITVTDDINSYIPSEDYTLTTEYKLTSESIYTTGLPINAGTYNIKINATYTGSDNYSSPSEVIVTFTIKQKELTFSSSTLNIDYDSSIRTWDSLQESMNSIIPIEGIIDGDAVTPYIDGMHNGKYFYGEVTGSYVNQTKTTEFGSSYKNVIGSTYLAFVSIDNDNYVLSSNELLVKYKTALISSTYYTIEDAFATTGTISFAGDSTSTNTYVATAFTELPTSVTGYASNTTFTLSGRTMIVPYANNTTEYTNVVGTTSGYVYSGLIIPSSVTINLASSATLTAAAQFGAIGGGKCTIPAFRGVIVNYGTINVASGCKLKSYGFVKGTGLINLSSGSTTVDVMCSYDWPGGTASSSMYSKVFLTNSYTIHNNSCKTIINAGASYQGYLMANISSSAKNATVDIIGANSSSKGMFKPTGSTGFITKGVENYEALCCITTDNQTIDYKDIFELNGNYKDGTVSVTVYVTVSTSTSKPTPIGLMKLTVKSGSTLDISSADYLFLPGSSLTIEEGATLNVTSSSVDITFATLSEIQDKTIGGSRIFTSNSYSKDHSDAYLLCNGTLNCSGNFGGKIITTSESATIKLNSKTTTSYTCMYSTSSPYYFTGSGKTTMYMYSNTGVDSKLTTISSTGTYYSIKDSKGNYGFYTSSGTLSYNSNGGVGTYSDKYITIGSSGYTITSSDVSNTPTRTHYTFDGWYTDDSFTTIALGSTIYCGIELIAKWTPITYSINYNDVYSENFSSGNTSTSSNSTSFTYETNVALTDATNSNYVFAGWYTNSSCANEYKITTLTGDSLVSLLSGSSITLYALWYEAGTTKYIIYYENDNTNITCVEKDSLVINDSFSWDNYLLPDMTLQDNDYTITKYFGGWYNNESLITTLDSSMFVLNETTNVYEITLTAKWIDKNSLIISVNKNDLATVYYKPGFVFSIPSLESKGITLPDKNVFICWEFDDATTCKAGDSIQLNSQTKLSAVIKTYVKVVIGSNSYTSVTVTLTSGEGYIVDISTGTAVATLFNGETKSSGATFYITTDSKFEAKYTISSGTNNGATISGSNPTTALTTSNQTYTATTSDITITPNGESSSCVAEGTLITLADGSMKKVEDLTADDMLLVFNHETGKYEAANIIFNDHDEEVYNYVIYLEFSNGRTVKVITEHGFFDLTTMQYEYIDMYNYESFIGHEFYGAEIIDGVYEENIITLTNAYVIYELVECYSPVTVYHLNYFTEGILSMPGGITGLFNIFDYDEDLKFNSEQMKNDIETYGVFTYEDFMELLPYEVYACYPAKYFKIAIAKGILTFDMLEYYINRYGAMTI